MKQTLLFLFFITFNLAVCQVEVYGGLDAQQLTQEHLIGNPNFPASNFVMVNGNQFGGPNSVGIFTCIDPTVIPFEEGIILSTGNATGIVGLPTDLISTGGNSWPGDSELEALTSSSDLFNASSLQFDFVSEVPAISFDFMMASEEYDNIFECNYADNFAFIIKNNTTGVSENVAVVPGTDIPISTTTVNNSTNCPSNEAYFFQYNTIGFGGQTVVFVLTGDLVIGDSYTIKIVIADQNDRIYDSALFVRNSSFGAYPMMAQEPMDLVVDDTDDDGIEMFDLTANEALMLGDINTTIYSFDFGYYHTLADAESQANPIANPQAYTNTADLEDIYVSMRNSYTGTSITTQFKITIDGNLLAVNEFETNTATLYPNPVVDALHIDGNASNIYSIEVYTINGQLLSSNSYQNTTSTTVDFSNYGSGMYLVKVVTDAGSSYKRIMK